MHNESVMPSLTNTQQWNAQTYPVTAATHITTMIAAVRSTTYHTEYTNRQTNTHRREREGGIPLQWTATAPLVPSEMAKNRLRVKDKGYETNLKIHNIK